LMLFRIALFPIVWVLEKFSGLLSSKQIQDKHLGSQFTH